MSTSKKQIRANRANARKSTGTKTPEGKRISSRNGIKHGLYSKDRIINSLHLKENREEYDHILAAIKMELRPKGVLQEFLVRKIADCLWLSRRAARAETAQIKRQLHLMNDELPPNIAVGISSIPKGAAGSDILRYELRVERQLNRSLNLFLRLKKAENSSLSDSYMDYLNSPLPDLPQDLASRASIPCVGKNPFPPPPEAEDSHIVGPPENEQTNPFPLAPEDINSLPNN